MVFITICGLRLKDHDYPESQKTVFTLRNFCILASLQSDGSGRCLSAVTKGCAGVPSPKISAFLGGPSTQLYHSQHNRFSLKYLEDLKLSITQTLTQWEMLSPGCGDRTSSSDDMRKELEYREELSIKWHLKERRRGGSVQRGHHFPLPILVQ